MAHQFPPSSPLHSLYEHSDPFQTKGKDIDRGRFQYATPHPSSATGRSSSPARLPVKARRRVSINRDFNILNPSRDVLRVPLFAKDHIFLGRSSKSCDYQVSANDKLVSRLHVLVRHTSSSITIECLGFNGFGIILPYVCSVTQRANGRYVLAETGKPLRGALSKSIHVDYHHTEFQVNRGETLEMPRFGNVLMQIGKQTVLLNPDDVEEDVTDDEAEQARSGLENESMRLESSDKCPEINHKSLENHKSPGINPKCPESELPTDNVEVPTEGLECPSEQSEELDEEPAARLDADHPSAPSLSPSARSESPTPIHREPRTRKRAVSEEPVPKRLKADVPRDKNGKLIIDKRCLAGVPDAKNLENILINHLAFSRLASTPASFLNTILAAVLKLRLDQLRAMLHQIPCLGVIYREGKDAAGKPLEEEYYYMPEKDTDQARINLMAQVKGRGGLRACRKTHKQYYWKKPAPIKK